MQSVLRELGIVSIDMKMNQSDAFNWFPSEQWSSQKSYGSQLSNEVDSLSKFKLIVDQSREQAKMRSEDDSEMSGHKKIDCPTIEAPQLDPKNRFQPG